jgi:hypothetical protein
LRPGVGDTYHVLVIFLILFVVFLFFLIFFFVTVDTI